MVPELFYKNVPESLANMDTILPMATGCGANFGHLTTLTFQCNFKCKSYLVRYDHRNLICEESSYSM